MRNFHGTKVLGLFAPGNEKARYLSVTQAALEKSFKSLAPVNEIGGWS